MTGFCTDGSNLGYPHAIELKPLGQLMHKITILSLRYDNTE